MGGFLLHRWGFWSGAGKLQTNLHKTEAGLVEHFKRQTLAAWRVWNSIRDYRVAVIVKWKTRRTEEVTEKEKKKHCALRKGRLQKELSSVGIEVASVVSTGQTTVVCTAGRLQERVDSSDKTMRVSVNWFILLKERTNVVRTKISRTFTLLIARLTSVDCVVVWFWEEN